MNNWRTLPARLPSGQRLDGFRGESNRRLSYGSQLDQEMVGQQRDVFTALGQRQSAMTTFRR
jgi:hypothetical protein